ncbi:DUF4811 domain-containing protein [Limosilactobacillus avium]|uniref:DUF4811 domain-containing protein n=1 Tax=Limosilactobacillus avium TaxID=2991831 RepID=UPI0024B8E6B7|nr:DUF4811 domain-containing protein [Limosilactobacillus avium]
MIIIIMFASAVALFASIMFINRLQVRVPLTILMGIIFVGSTAMMTLNYSHHFGMHQETTTTKKVIYSASNSSLPLALYQPVGTSGKDDVYIYNSKKRQKTPDHTQANEYTHSKIKWTKRLTPRLVTTETRWRYNNGFFRIMYMGTGMDGTLVKRTNVLEYPQAYVKITTKQAGQLKKQAASPAAKKAQATAAEQGRSAVAAKVQQALAQNPKMSASQIQRVTLQAEQEVQAQAVKAMLK